MASENFTEHVLGKKQFKDQFREYQQKLLGIWNPFKVFGINSNVNNRRLKNLKTCLDELQDILYDMLQERQIGNNCKRFSIDELKQIEEISNTIPHNGSYEADYKIRDLFKQNILNILKTSHFSLLSKLMSDQNTALSTLYIIKKIYEANCTSTNQLIEYDAEAVMEPRSVNSPTIMASHEKMDSAKICQSYWSRRYPAELQLDGEFESTISHNLINTMYLPFELILQGYLIIILLNFIFRKFCI